MQENSSFDGKKIVHALAMDCMKVLHMCDCVEPQTLITFGPLHYEERKHIWKDLLQDYREAMISLRQQEEYTAYVEHSEHSQKGWESLNEKLKLVFSIIYSVEVTMGIM
jgi:hypothetical protein